MKRFFTIFGLLALISSSSVLNAQVPTNGLVGYWPFNGNANDESGNGNHGLVNGATLTTDRFGNQNSAYYFDGISNNIVGTPLNFPLGNSARTISAWFNINVLTTDRNCMIINWGPSTNNNSNALYPALQGGQKKLVYDSYGNGVNINYNFQNLVWNHIVAIYDGNNVKIYFNNQLIVTEYKPNWNTTQTEFNIGSAWGWNGFFPGKLDDIRVYNRVLNQAEITALFLESPCSVITNDTTTYFVSSNEFQSLSPQTFFVSADTLITQIGSCDSIINHYSEFVYNPTYCSTTDTLIINVTLSGITPPNNINTIKIYPNPANTFVIINTGNYGIMSNYTIRIENMSGQLVYQTLTNQQEFQIDVNNFGGYGTYIVKIIDNTSIVIETRKIILN